MSTSDTDYSQIWQQVRQWPAEQRRSLAEQINQSLLPDPPPPQEEWTDAKNDRRCELIDKDIQDSLSTEERQELESLTQQLREYRRRVAPIPIAGARRLHQQLLDKKRQQQASSPGEAE